jgi:ABC-type sugar transport system ATPase subunit
MGKTGSGKTTIIEALCGLKPVLKGRIHFDGRDVTALPPAARGVGFVPQDGALFSTLTVREHLEFALRVRRWKRDAVEFRVQELAKLLGISDLLRRRPAGLSGGEKQRVALGRALSFEPSVLCLDEPLSALDDPTREEMCELLRSVQARSGVTVLHITHSLDDAERLAEKLLVLRDGVVEEAPWEPRQNVFRPAARVAKAAGGER